jgi:hypothetical protein
MKGLTVGLAVLFASVFLWTSRAELAEIDPVGKILVEGGAEKEPGFSAGGRGTIELLGVMPLTQNFGLQGIAHYIGGLGSRYGLSAGPIFGWESGKAGFFVAYQHRTFNDNNFVHLRPSVAFYLPQANINLFYSQPVSSPQRSRTDVEFGINQLNASVGYFPGVDLASFMKKDNLELTLGIEANSFAGAGSGKIPNGVGPVFGLAFMPMQNLEVNVVRGTIDHHGRYNVLSGISFYFDKGDATLKELRRRYLEPNYQSGGAGGRIKKETVGCGLCDGVPRGQL